MSLDQLVLQSERAAELGDERVGDVESTGYSPLQRVTDHGQFSWVRWRMSTLPLGRMRQVLFHRRDVAQSGRVAGEDKVTTFYGHVTGKAATQTRSIDRFAVVKLGESPTACRRVFF